MNRCSFVGLFTDALNYCLRSAYTFYSSCSRYYTSKVLRRVLEKLCFEYKILGKTVFWKIQLLWCRLEQHLFYLHIIDMDNRYGYRYGYRYHMISKNLQYYFKKQIMTNKKKMFLVLINSVTNQNIKHNYLGYYYYYYVFIFRYFTVNLMFKSFFFFLKFNFVFSYDLPAVYNNHT